MRDHAVITVATLSAQQRIRKLLRYTINPSMKSSGWDHI